MGKTNSAVVRHLKSQWEKACNSYLLELLNRWEWDACYGYWLSDEVGSVYFYGDTYVMDMDEIRYCVENSVSKEDFCEYLEYNTDACSLGFDNINLHSWMKGCPRLSKEQIQHLYDLTSELNEETERMKEQLKNGKNNPY